jgi:hypothetical protein
LTCVFAVRLLLTVQPPRSDLLVYLGHYMHHRARERRGETWQYRGIISSRDDGHSPISFGTFQTRRGFIGSLTQALGAPFFSVLAFSRCFDVLDGYPGRTPVRSSVNWGP